MKLDKLLKTIVAALEDIKARDIVILDVTRMTALFDRMIIASADSTRQTKALANNVQVKVKAAGGEVYGMEGEQSGEWVLVDLGDVVVHVMQPAVRGYYNLEELWAEAEAVKVKKAAASTTSAVKKKIAAKPRKVPPKTTSVKKTVAKPMNTRKPPVKRTATTKTKKSAKTSASKMSRA